ncbi:MAG: transporter [Betaproteobacteria bacterium RIFCSPLOWO2_12_FULL_62_13b]|nr:MAG: transporter [Betaproteobacteria bacterium RIFCSPLOWO2_12_FULL_62_13b]
MRRAAALFAAAVLAAIAATPACAQNLSAQAAAVVSVELNPGGDRAKAPALGSLIAEALQNNPELRAAAKETEAAGERVRPAGALEDPMLEAGVLNVPIQPFRLNREDMTMKMLGLSQKLPYPGKRALREQVAAKDAETLVYGLRETSNRVVRDVKLAYFDLALTDETVRLLQSNRLILEQFLRIAESRYAVGQAAQADVLKAQTQLGRMSEELLRMERERPVMEAELVRLLGRRGNALPIAVELPSLREAALNLESLQEAVLRERPQLLGLQSAIERSGKTLELARKEAQPDFDLRFSYGQRERDLAGMPREDMVSFTVAMNLPVWRKDKIEPRIAEAQALREQTLEMLRAQQNETLARLRQQVAVTEQSRKSVHLYQTTILPQARLAVEATLAAYKVSRADVLMLLDSQMSLFGYEISRAKELVNFNKSLAEIELLTGKQMF